MGLGDELNETVAGGRQNFIMQSKAGYLHIGDNNAYALTVTLRIQRRHWD